MAKQDTRKTQRKDEGPSFQDIAKALRACPEDWATEILGEAPNSRSRGQVRYFENNSLVVFTSGNNQGRFKWFCDDSSKSKGDMVDLFIFHRGGTPHDAIQYAKNFLQIESGDVSLPDLAPRKSEAEIQREQEAENRERIRKAQWIWNNGSARDGREAGLAYLAGRGITTIPGDDTLRFRTLSHKDLAKMGIPDEKMPDGPVVSVMLAARNPAGVITAVQQILTYEGRKADVPNNKRTNGIMQGSAVWLGDPATSERAALAEGPETGLSIHQATGLATCITLGTSNYMHIGMPENVKDLVIASDIERTGIGLGFALRAAQEWKRRGVPEVGIALPRVSPSGDFNDVHQAQGEDAVKAAFDNAYYAPHRDRDGTVLATADTRAAFNAWYRTGIEVMPRVPARDPKSRRFRPISLDSMVEPRHNRVLVVQTPGIEIEEDMLRRNRPEVEIVPLHGDSREFREMAHTPGAMEEVINAVDFYAPEGKGENEPVFLALRRDDADALRLEGYKSIAVRSTAIDRTDFGFLSGREAIIAPIGNGTDADRHLAEKCSEAGARTTRLTWQIFRADQAVPSIVRKEIPDGFGACDAAKEGWTGRALSDLVEISRANHRQMDAPRVVDDAPRAARKTAGMER